MERKEYVNRSDMILEKHDRLENELLSLIYEYYKDSPEEKGNENTHFYKEMRRLIDEFERDIPAMRYNLKDPDDIQSYDTQ